MYTYRRTTLHSHNVYYTPHHIHHTVYDAHKSSILHLELPHIGDEVAHQWINIATIRAVHISRGAKIGAFVLQILLARKKSLQHDMHEKKGCEVKFKHKYRTRQHARRFAHLS